MEWKWVCQSSGTFLKGPLVCKPASSCPRLPPDPWKTMTAMLDREATSVMRTKNTELGDVSVTDPGTGLSLVAFHAKEERATL